MAYSSIVKPTDYFNTVLHTGNGSTQSITGVGFQPDWVWIKGRSVAAGGNLSDVVRGVNKQLQSASNAAEEALTTCVTAFDSDGFSLGSNGNVNGSSNTYVSWNWKANGTSTTNPSGGTITTTASVNTTAGFSVFTYTGNGSAAHIAHGLGVAPTVVIVKVRSTTDHWFVKHPGIASNEYLYLNGNSAKVSGANAWSATNPDATKIYIGTDGGVNGSGETYVCYAFAEKKGYSKFGSYVGNGNADGTFVYTGFKPAWILIKDTGSTQSWFMYDNTRDTINPNTKLLTANNTGAEEDSASTGNTFDVDFLSNGFKIRTTDGGVNTSGNTYVYMCFAENPFVGNDSGTAVPVTAE
jgi:hypothetical protein